MTVLRRLPALVSLLLLGAHFLRSGSFLAISIAVVLMALLFVPRPWAIRVAQVGLVVGALEWVRTVVTLVLMRQQMGEPYARLAIILGAVVVFTGLSALALQRAVRTSADPVGQ